MRSTPPRWHPILGVSEGPVGVWTLMQDLGTEQRPYAVVRIVRRGPEVGYRAEAAPTGVVLGYWTTLMRAIEEAHQAHLSAATAGLSGGQPWSPTGRSSPWTAAPTTKEPRPATVR